MVEISGEVKEWDAVEGMRNDFHQLSHVYRSSSAHFIRPKIRRVSTMTTSAHTHVIPVGRHGPLGRSLPVSISLHLFESSWGKSLRMSLWTTRVPSISK